MFGPSLGKKITQPSQATFKTPACGVSLGQSNPGLHQQQTTPGMHTDPALCPCLLSGESSHRIMSTSVRKPQSPQKETFFPLHCLCPNQCGQRIPPRPQSRPCKTPNTKEERKVGRPGGTPRPSSLCKLRVSPRAVCKATEKSKNSQITGRSKNTCCAGEGSFSSPYKHACPQVRTWAVPAYLLLETDAKEQTAATLRSTWLRAPAALPQPKGCLPQGASRALCGPGSETQVLASFWRRNETPSPGQAPAAVTRSPWDQGRSSKPTSGMRRCVNTGLPKSETRRPTAY